MEETYGSNYYRGVIDNPSFGPFFCNQENNNSGQTPSQNPSQTPSLTLGYQIDDTDDTGYERTIYDGHDHNFFNH